MIRKKHQSSGEKEMEREIDALMSYGAENMSFARAAFAREIKPRGYDDRDIEELTK